MSMPVEDADQLETCFSEKPGKVSLCFTSPRDQLLEGNDMGDCGASFTPLQRTSSDFSEI